MSKVATLDIESNNLLGNMLNYSSFPYKLRKDAKLWVLSICDISDFSTKSLVKEQITRESVEELLSPFDVIIAHNGHKFDLVVLSLFGIIDYKIGYMGEKDYLNGREIRFIDTLVLSRFINPDRVGGHGLGSWGERVGVSKTDYRQELIDLGVIDKSLPKGEEFRFFHPLMVEYCEQDCITTAHTYLEILKEYKGYTESKLGLQMEHKLADLAVRRETLGFFFDKESALGVLEELNSLMGAIADKVNPLLPKKAMSSTVVSGYTPPVNQLKKDGSWSSHMLKFFDRNGITEYNNVEKWFKYKGNIYEVPYVYPVEWQEESTIDDLDVVKNELIRLGWIPTEWRERDLIRDSKKNIISFERRHKALRKYVDETLGGKYKELRLKKLEATEENLYSKLYSKIRGNNPLRVPTSPSLRVGVSKDLCPSLEELGDAVSFAKDVADYFTYRHRRSAIAGGDTVDMDFESDTPDTGYLANLREDSRISTPAIEIGASTGRYRHITVANVPRASSLFGKEMRSLFGSGKGSIQFGFDYASLEARIEGHYVFPYKGGEEASIALMAEKPNDIHTITGHRLGIIRDDAKSVNYAIRYGASPKKFEIMLQFTPQGAVKFVEDWWDVNPALKELKQDKEKEWMDSGRKYIKSIDGRRINIRSQHSIINALFQSSGVICAKYVMVLMYQKFERQGLVTDPFKGKPDVCSMIEYHDENQLYTNPKLLSFKTFNTKEEAKDFCKGFDGGQLGAIQEGKNGKFFIALPSVISKTISSSIKEVEKMFSMNVGLGYEYVCGKNWYDCH